jgi:hypothetical protein
MVISIGNYNYQSLSFSKEQCEERVKSLKKYLSPFQEIISESSNQLISVLNIYKKQCGFDTSNPFYNINQSIQVGIITPTTQFSFLKDEYSYLISMSILENIETPLKLEVESCKSNFYNQNGNCFFFDETSDIFQYLFKENFSEYLKFFSEEILVPQQNDLDGSQKPEMQFYIGNKPVIKFLENQLNGYQYTGLSKLLGRGLPIREEMKTKIYNEKWNLIQKTKQIESKCKSLMEKYSIRLEHAETSELMDKVAVHLNFKGEVDEQTEQYKQLLQEGINRGYHECDEVLKKDDGRGITTEINLRKFYESRYKILFSKENSKK